MRPVVWAIVAIVAIVATSQRSRAERRGGPAGTALVASEPHGFRRRRPYLFAQVLGAVTFALSAPQAALAQAEAEATCRPPRATVEFVGKATAIEGSTVNFRIIGVRSGEAGVDALEVDYPSDHNVRFIDLDESYLVGANLVRGRYRSMVPTARDECVGRIRTGHADGSVIDTGTFAGAKERLPTIARTLAIVVLGALVVLILIGRLFDGRRAYG